tara:strand:- start:201 stop:866 length:666 start_codon:yes stop_codon:yes gene_type:complete
MNRLLIFILIFTACVAEEVVDESNESIVSNQETTTTSVTTTTLTSSDPVVKILNCPSFDISNNSYELQFRINSGSGDIVNLGIFEAKNGENHKNVFFDIEYNADIFTFPSANTINEYSYVVDNVDNSNSSTHLIEINVISENGSGGDSCEMIYTPSHNSSTTSSNEQSKPENPGDTKNCGDFADYAEAKAWFDTYYEYYGDVANLDSDDDLEPCESLPGGP